MGESNTCYYNRRGGVMEIRIRDSDGRTIDRMKESCNNRKKCAELLNHIKKKYGFDSATVEEIHPLSFENVWFK